MVGQFSVRVGGFPGLYTNSTDMGLNFSVLWFGLDLEK